MKIKEKLSIILHKIANAWYSDFFNNTSLLFLVCLIFFLLFKCCSVQSHATQISLAWDASESSEVTGYKIYYGTTSGQYTDRVDVGNVLSYTLFLDDGPTYYFAATAYLEPDGMQSEYSNEVFKDTTINPIYFAITSIAGTGGMISPSGTNLFLQSANSTFVITPDVGYRITDVKIDGISVGPVSTYTFTNITADHIISASFQLIVFLENYTITATASNNWGSISPSGSVSISQGSSVTFHFIPNNKNFIVNYVVIDGINKGILSFYTFNNIQSNHTITAYFKRRR